MPASELIERAADLLSQTDAATGGALHDELVALERRLREPARVAVIGRVKAGKSTLVNALLGQRVAPTAVSECTQVVTWFHYGQPQRVEMRLRDGSVSEVQLAPDGMLPRELGVPVAAVDSLHVYLANDALRSMTLIDTPGIGSAHVSYSDATKGLLGTSPGVDTDTADATVLLLNHTLLQDEVDALELFRSQAGESGSAANAVGVLTRVDQLGDGRGDVFEVAVELADQYLDVLDTAVAAVVPVAGLVAETAETASLLESDARDLATLATMDPTELRRILRTPDRFVAATAPIDTAARERLWTLLDRVGLQWALAAIDEQAHGAAQIRKELALRSGIADVKRTLTQRFATQDHVLKVRSVLDALVRLSYVDGGTSAAQQELRTAVEEIRLDPVMHPVAELEAWHAICSARVAIPDGARDELRVLFGPGSTPMRLRLPSGASTDEQRAAARDGMSRWRTFMVTNATPDEARLARTVLRSYQLIWESLV